MLLRVEKQTPPMHSHCGASVVFCGWGHQHSGNQRIPPARTHLDITLDESVLRVLPGDADLGTGTLERLVEACAFCAADELIVIRRAQQYCFAGQRREDIRHVG